MSEFAFYLWLGAAVVLFILELLTLSFFLLCFSVGAVAAAVCALCGMGTGGQILAFAVGSLLAFVFIRPLLIRHFNRRSASRPKTNVDALVGKKARVVEAIEGGIHCGRVTIDGDNWQARSEDGTAIGEGEIVDVTGIDSIILSVKKITN